MIVSYSLVRKVECENEDNLCNEDKLVKKIFNVRSHLGLNLDIRLS